MAHRKLRRMTAPAGNMQKKRMANLPVDRTASSSGERGCDMTLGEEEEDPNNPFLFQSFVQHGQRKSGYEGLGYDEEDDDVDDFFAEGSGQDSSGRSKSFYHGVPVTHRHERNNSRNQPNQPRDIKIINDPDAPSKQSGGSSSSGSGKNPFSFKKFVKKDKRRAVYYDNKEGQDAEMEFGDMGNQNGAVPDGRDPQGREGHGRSGGGGGGGGHGGHGGGGGHGGHGGHGGGGGGAAAQVEKAQRRATSSGVPSRSRGKQHRNANSTVNPSTSPQSAAVQSAASPGSDVDHGMNSKQGPNASNEFVDFIYDYATKNEDGKDPPAPPPKGKMYQDKNDKDSPAVPERRHGRERARAHTHGNAARKQKHAARDAAQKAANHKSQLVTNYMDDGGGLSSALTVPNLAMGNESDPHSDDCLSQKVAELKNAGRERARAQSHGHRKKDAKQKQNKMDGHRPHHNNLAGNTAQSVPEIAAAIAAENGHGIYAKRGEEEESHYDTPKRHHSPSDGPDITYDAVQVQEINEPIPDNMPDLIAEVKKLRNNNAKLRRELVDAKKAVEKDARKIDGMEQELRRLRHREAEDAKTLETMVQHVEANLKRTTERAVTAENTITKLKAEIKTLKTEVSSSGGGNKKKPTQESKDYKDMKDKAHAASLKLASAAKEAETNIKQLMAGVDVLKLMAETLACIDRVTEEKTSKEKNKEGGYGTSL